MLQKRPQVPVRVLEFLDVDDAYISLYPVAGSPRKKHRGKLRTMFLAGNRCGYESQTSDFVIWEVDEYNGITTTIVHSKFNDQPIFHSPKGSRRTRSLEYFSQEVVLGPPEGQRQQENRDQNSSGDFRVGYYVFDQVPEGIEQIPDQQDGQYNE